MLLHNVLSLAISLSSCKSKIFLRLMLCAERSLRITLSRLVWCLPIRPFMLESDTIAKLRARKAGLLSSLLKTCPSILHLEAATRSERGLSWHFLYSFSFESFTFGHCILTICLRCFLWQMSSLSRVLYFGSVHT